MEESLVTFLGPIVGLFMSQSSGDRTAAETLQGVLNTTQAVLNTIKLLKLAAPFIKVILIICLIAACLYLIYKAVEWAVEQIIDAMEFLADQIRELMINVGEWIVDFMNSIRQAINNFREWVRARRERAGINYAANNPHILVNTNLLRHYAERINTVNTRLNNLNSASRWLWTHVRLRDLFSALATNFLIRESRTLNHVRNYMNDAARDFESADNQARGIMGG